MILDYYTQTFVSVCIDHRTGHSIYISHKHIYRPLKAATSLVDLVDADPPPPQNRVKPIWLVAA